MNLNELVTFMESELEKDDAKYMEAGFVDVDELKQTIRGLIAMGQLGEVARYAYHDQLLNPTARPHGSREDDAATCGHAILQVIGFAVARGFTVAELERGIEAAMAALADDDWKARPQSSGDLRGTVAWWGGPFVDVSGIVCFGFDEVRNRIVGQSPPAVVVVPHITPDDVRLFIDSRIVAVVTDHGGMTSHAAILAREFRRICVVSTGDATKRLKSESNIVIHHDGTISSSRADVSRPVGRGSDAAGGAQR